MCSVQKPTKKSRESCVNRSTVAVFWLNSRAHSGPTKCLLQVTVYGVLSITGHGGIGRRGPSQLFSLINPFPPHFTSEVK